MTRTLREWMLVVSAVLAAAALATCGPDPAPDPGPPQVFPGPEMVPPEAEVSPESPPPEETAPDEPEVRYRLGALGGVPDWGSLEAFQRTMTRERFVDLLEGVFSEEGSSRVAVEVGPDAAEIVTSTASGAASAPFRLEFAATEAELEPAPAPWWRAAAGLPPAADRDGRPLEGVRIAIDPGHIGGRWSTMEERWFQIGGGEPVMEGSMTLVVAEHLRGRLEALGATVGMVRSANEPVTDERPTDFIGLALDDVHALGLDPDTPDDPVAAWFRLRKAAEKYFYRVSEIHARAGWVNETFRPDLVLCLHFNAEAWGNPAQPRLVPKNHLHLLVNGCYSGWEMRLDDQRFEMVRRLLEGVHPLELELSDSVAKAMAEATGLPAYVYTGSNAKPLGETGYVWARNLLANRTFRCPVVFLEPYVMNSRTVYDRIQAGDYEDTRKVAGEERPSIFREYADAVAEGVAAHFRERRP